MADSTSAKAHEEPTRSDHKPVLFERVARDEFIMEIKSQRARTARWRSSPGLQHGIVVAGVARRGCAATGEPPQGQHAEVELGEMAKDELQRLEHKADELRRVARCAPSDAQPHLGRALWRLHLRRAKNPQSGTPTRGR